MRLFRIFAIAVFALIAVVTGQGADAAERRLALVIGEAAYPSKPIATAANDAGLIAQTLQAAGFDVTGARDLEEAALKQAFRDFLDKAAGSGPDTVAVVYVSGYGVQLEGENYILPVDAAIARDSDIPLRGLRISDYLKPLATLGSKLNIVVLDIGRPNPFSLGGQPLAGGLALYEPGGKTLLAYNAAPGTIAEDVKGDYGPYAHALAEMIRDGGRPLTDVFETTRLRVSELTKGAQIPWNSQKIETDFVFFQRDANAPPRADDAARAAEPIGKLGPQDGFSAAVRADTLQGYQDYVATYPASPYAKRARAMLAARREALTWRRTRIMDTPDAYWSYLQRYPKGPHVWDAHRRLAELQYEFEPPPSFEVVDYGYPPPPPEEIVYIQQPVVYFGDPIWAFAPPPPPPIFFLPPPPPDFIFLPPPVIIATPYMLPAPPYVPIPVWVSPPPYIAPPPPNLIYANIHNAVALDPTAERLVVRNPTGAVISTEALTAAGAGAAAIGAGAAAIGVGAALPNFLAKRNAVAPTAPGASPGQPIPAGGAHPVPGATPGAPAPGIAPSTTGLPKEHALPIPGAAGGPHNLVPTGPAQGAAQGAAKGAAQGAAPVGPGKDHALPRPATGAPHEAAPPTGSPAAGHGRDHAAPTAPGLGGAAGAGSQLPSTAGAPSHPRDHLGAPGAGAAQPPSAGRPRPSLHGGAPDYGLPGAGSQGGAGGPRGPHTVSPSQGPGGQPGFGSPHSAAPGGMRGGQPGMPVEEPTVPAPHRSMQAPMGMPSPGMREPPLQRAQPRMPDYPAPAAPPAVHNVPQQVPPQMREAAPSYMRAPTAQPPAAARQPVYQQPAAPPRPHYDGAPAPHGGGFGGGAPAGGGFGGGRPGGFGGF